MPLLEFRESPQSFEPQQFTKLVDSGWDFYGFYEWFPFPSSFIQILPAQKHTKHIFHGVEAIFLDPLFWLLPFLSLTKGITCPRDFSNVQCDPLILSNGEASSQPFRPVMLSWVPCCHTMIQFLGGWTNKLPGSTEFFFWVLFWVLFGGAQLVFLFEFPLTGRWFSLNKNTCFGTLEWQLDEGYWQLLTVPNMWCNDYLMTVANSY